MTGRKTPETLGRLETQIKDEFSTLSREILVTLGRLETQIKDEFSTLIPLSHPMSREILVTLGFIGPQEDVPPDMFLRHPAIAQRYYNMAGKLHRQIETAITAKDCLPTPGQKRSMTMSIVRPLKNELELTNRLISSPKFPREAISPIDYFGIYRETLEKIKEERDEKATGFQAMIIAGSIAKAYNMIGEERSPLTLGQVCKVTHFEQVEGRLAVAQLVNMTQRGDWWKLVEEYGETIKTVRELYLDLRANISVITGRMRSIYNTQGRSPSILMEKALNKVEANSIVLEVLRRLNKKMSIHKFHVLTWAYEQANILYEQRDKAIDNRFDSRKE